ncbi:MAG TPA: hypothetical protein VMU43_07840 [Candidatus Acidoferrum sp.]|nr:hypothetical protein [Candidatus Acidoferrum sp.]
MRLVELWRRFTTTRHARELEAEIARQRMELERQRAENERLRAENRALLNSILGIAGIPPIVVADAAQGPAAGGVTEQASLGQSEKGKGSAVAPTRRRSWHQVMRGLELASARKERPETQ